MDISIWIRRLIALALLFVVALRPAFLWPATTSLFIWLGAMIASLTFFIAECFNPALTFTRRLGMAYLLVTGIIYAYAGAWGLYPEPNLIEPFMWSLLVSPYIWITLVTSHGGGYGAVLEEPHRFSSAIVLCLGLIAVGAALAMSRSKKIGYQIWMALLCLIIFLIGGYVVAAIRFSAGPVLGFVCGWLITYIVAFWLAYRGNEPHKVKD
jgi:hypothetical protein